MNKPDIIPESRPSKSILIIPLSLIKDHGLTLHQAGFLSLLYYDPEFGRLSNRELARLMNPDREPYPGTAAYHIRTLRRKGLLVSHGSGKTRRLQLTLAAKRAIRDVKKDPTENKYIGVPIEDWLGGGSMARRINAALRVTLEENYPDLANPHYMSRALGVTPDAVKYHQNQPIKNFPQPIKNFGAYNIYNLLIPYQEQKIINPVDKSTGSGLRPATVPVSIQFTLSGGPMYPDQYSKNQSHANQSPAKPQPKSKPFTYSHLACPQRRARLKKKPLAVPPTHRTELESLARLPHIAQHHPGTRAMYDSCKVVFYLKTGLGNHMSQAMIDKVWDDLKWRDGADRAKLEEILAKKWTAAERLELFEALNNSLDPSYGYKGARKKISLSEAFYNVDYGFSQLIKVAMLPPKVEEKKQPTPVQVPEDLKEMADAILKATNEPKPTVRFVDMLNDLKRYWEEEVRAKLVEYNVCTFTFKTWWSSMVDFITWDCDDDPKWPFFKPGTSPFARWERECRDRIRYDIQNEAWKRRMNENRQRMEIEEWRRYMEDEGVYFASYEGAKAAWEASYGK